MRMRYNTVYRLRFAPSAAGPCPVRTAKASFGLMEYCPIQSAIRALAKRTSARITQARINFLSLFNLFLRYARTANTVRA